MKKEFIKIKVDELIPYENNPRINENAVPDTMESIRQCENLDPIEVDENNVILSGHTRLLALKRLGYNETEVVRYTGLTEEQKKKYRILANKVGEKSEWDFSKLEEELADIDFGDFDFGFEIDSKEKKEGTEDTFDVDSELKRDVFSKLGDLWLLGKHRVICGDSTGEEVYTRVMDGQKANLVLTDPPYNVNVEETAGKIMNDNMGDSEFYNFLLSAYRCMHANLADDGSIYVFHADTEGLNFRKAFKDAGFYLSGCCIWKKNALVLGRSPYQWIHEPCSVEGTLVWTPSGKIPIEELKDGDRVISFDTYSGTVKGYKDGVPVKTAHRHYEGDVYGVRIGESQTWVTNNHQFSVRFNPETSNKWCTYLMVNEDGWWRVGCTRAYDARQFGLKGRIHTEKAVAAWIVAVHESSAEAQIYEQFLSTKYGIPYTYWTENKKRGITAVSKTARTADDIRWLYDQFSISDLKKKAEKLLSDYGRSIDYPLITKETGEQKFSRRVTAKVNACNLIPNVMMLPMPFEGYNGNSTFEWKPIEAVERKPYSGEVYSLEVEKYEHYIADGIVTHNCLFGWKQKGKHQWYSDRKQTTVWEYDKPRSSADHPTMKPIPLMCYPIQNSTMTNGVVLDPFLGSGSTLIACCQTNRICRGIELDPKFVDVIVKRYIEWNDNRVDDVFVIRDGEKLPFTAVATLENVELAD